MTTTKTIAVLLILVIFLQPLTATASSSEGDPNPPSGGGGGGSSPQFFDYYIPLIFNNSHKAGESSVIVWIVQQSIIIGSFGLDPSGINQMRVDIPQKLVFKPSTSPGLTNGSLIRLTAPAQVVGARESQDIFTDDSFSYSILPARMMGFEFFSPFDGFIAVFTNTQYTKVNLVTSSGEVRTNTMIIPGSKSFSVQAGEYINTSQPVIAAFYTSSITGTAAAMAVPQYLKGDEYIVNPKLITPTRYEITQTIAHVLPTVPTELTITYSNLSTSTVNIFGPTDILISSDIRGITAKRSDMTISLATRTYYAGTARLSTVQLIAAPEMRAGELFLVPNEFSSHIAVINQQTNISTIAYYEGAYVLKSRYVPIRDKYDILSINEKTSITLLLANHSLFIIAASPGNIGNPMSPSMAFLSLPLNTQTIYRNVTGAAATWYRFRNLAVQKIELLPTEPEDFTGETIRVTFISNGSLPASAFAVSIIIDGKEMLNTKYDFLQVNKTLVFEFRLFLKYKTSQISVSAAIDTESQVSESNEDDNAFAEVYTVTQNMRIRVSMVLLVLIVIAYTVRKLLRRWKAARNINKARFDAILTVSEIEEDIV